MLFGGAALIGLAVARSPRHGVSLADDIDDRCQMF